MYKNKCIFCKIFQKMAFLTFKVKFLKKPPFEFAKLRFFLMSKMCSLKPNRSRLLRIIMIFQPLPGRCLPHENVGL